MKKIELTKNKIALIDDDDYEIIKRHSWCYHTKGYAVTVINYKHTMMHNLIKPPPLGFINDHIDQDGLNNQKHNLRFLTKSQNLFNRPKNSNNTSGYKGVSWLEKNKKWVAHIRYQGRLKYLGSFVEKINAAIAYDKAASELIGPFAELNFPPDKQHKIGTL